MADIVQRSGFQVVDTSTTGNAGEARMLQQYCQHLDRLMDAWRGNGLPDSGKPADYTTASSVAELLRLVNVNMPTE